MILHRYTIYLVALFILLSPGTSTAVRLKGKLTGSSPSQYRVLAVGKNGQSSLNTVSVNGSFSVNARAGTTLHLIGADSRYAGPIVAARGARAYATLSGKKGSLGNVTVKSSFATIPSGKVNKIVSARPVISYNRTTGPRGAGKFGLVNVSNSSSKVQRSHTRIRARSPQVGQDNDGDGLPNILDIDDDGDLILDVSDPVGGATPNFETRLASTLRTTLTGAINKNISGLTDDEIDSVLTEGLILGFTFRKNSDSATVSSVNIDCGTLSYCTSDTGTATLRSDNLNELEGTPWIGYDPDDDGLPNLYADSEPVYAGVKPRAVRASLRTGDTLYFKAETSGGIVALPAVLPFYFVTAPTLKQYSSGIQSSTISYPVSSGAAGTTADSPFPMGASTLTLSFWKPQRPAIEGAEEGDYIDNGKLSYGLTLSVQNSSGVYMCTPGEYSNPSAGLEANSTTQSGTVHALEDTAADGPVSSDNVLSFTVDLGTCLSRQGFSASGTIVMIDLNATSTAGDQTSQSFFVQLPG